MKRVLALLTALLTATTLVACSNSDTKSTPTDHTKADVTFATEMIPHHGQAITMAKLAPSRASSPQVKALAARIEKAQDPEIKTMAGWLRTWGEKVPPPDRGGMAGHESKPGMMSAAEMAELTNAKGAAFDRMFLIMMIAHHQGAIEMAKTEQRKGKHPGAKKLAAQIEKAQTAEIDEMNQLLDG